MKKITLFLCLSIVGLVGFAQQSESMSNTNSNSNYEVGLKVNLDEINDAIDQDLLSANDFSEINFRDIKFENNSHELVHGTSNQNSLDSKYRQDAFSYNEYVLNFDYKLIKDWNIKY